MTTRRIQSVIPPPEIHWVGDGFRVHNFIPGISGPGMERMNPFVLLDYGSKYTFGPSARPRGIGVHPHRGFETVTVAYKGRIAHKDSTGSGGIIGEGDVQWMTAASGILHKEYHEEEWSRKGGEFQMVQLWVNLPAKYKMSQPGYQPLTNSQMGKAVLPGNSGIVEVIAGDYNSVKGPARTFTPMHLMNARLNAGAKATFEFPGHYNTALLVIEGSVRINDSEAIGYDRFVLFENNGQVFEVEATEQSTLLVMSGEPFDEPIASHGPFIMNTTEELIKAYEDYKSGRFGDPHF